MVDLSKEFIQKIIDSIAQPFYVIDVNTYRVLFANKACGFGKLNENSTCHLLTHKSPAPCSNEHICPLLEVKKNKQSFATEHIHYDHEGKPINMDVHGDPIFDEQGNLTMMIEYAFDITGHKEVEKELKTRLVDVEKYNKIMFGREKKILELKKEVDELLQELGREPKYKVL